MHLRKEGLGARHRLRVRGMHDGTFFEQALDYFQRRGEADVVGVCFEGQSEDGDALALHYPQRLADFFKIAVDALFVDAFGSLQEVKVHSDGSRQVNESLYVLRETETSIAQSGLEELAADARVESHGMGNFLDVCADFFAEIGDHVGVADFEREEGVRGVLDELGAVDGRDEEFDFVAGGAGSVVHRAAETLLENRAVDLAEFRGGGGILDADNNPVRVEKIRDGGAFAKKFRIGDDAEFNFAIFGIRGKGAVEFEASARGYGAFFDDEFGRFRFRGDLPGYVVDGRKVGLAGILRRGSHTDEDGVPGADGFTGVGGIGDPSSFVGRSENLVEVMLVDGDAAGIELGDALAIDVRANYLVSCVGEASSGDETHVPTSDN